MAFHVLFTHSKTVHLLEMCNVFVIYFFINIFCVTSDKDGDKAKTVQSDCEVMDIGDVDLESEASILAKEVKALFNSDLNE